MEVHHHPQTGKKRFKEYLLEFLMIFLAVTLGFFAEQIREYFANNAKVKEYMYEITENLRYDTTRCSGNRAENLLIEKGLDSLRSELLNASNGKINANALYYYTLRYTNNFGQVAFNTSAIHELQNSGSLRLIENVKLLTEISDYYERKVYAAQYFMPSASHFDELQSAANEIFSLDNLDGYVQAFKNMSEKTYDLTYDFKEIINHSPALELLNANPATLKKYSTLLSLHEIEIARYNFWIQYCKQEAEKLIVDIQKAYHLKDKVEN